MKEINTRNGIPKFALVAALLLLGVIALAYRPSQGDMLILRGIASPEAPRGQLDDDAALAYARKQGYTGEVLDIAADTLAEQSQIKVALDRIRQNKRVKAIYGFSGGGYNAQIIWSQLRPEERERIGKIVVVGSPGITPAAFPQAKDVVVQEDPPEGHMAGPKALLRTVSR